MKGIKIREIHQAPERYADQEITIHGWIRTNRGSKHFGFIELNDGSHFRGIQVVYEEALANFDAVKKFGISSSMQIKGTLVLTPENKQPYELKATEIEMLGDCPSEYPLQKKRHSFEYLRSIAHLRPRTNTFSAIFRIRSLAAYAIHQFFQDRGFVYVHTPIITGSDAEGAGEMFRVTTLDLQNLPRTEAGELDEKRDFFGKETNLTVSGQLSAETYALAMRDVYTFGPTFRAENSNTARHAAEFWMIEPEIAFADLQDDMEMAEDMLKYIITYVMEKAPEELEFFNKFVDKGLLERLQHVVASDFAHITYTEAIEILEKADKNSIILFRGESICKTEHERYITEEVYKRPVFVTDYPKEIKAFYMRMNDDNKTVAAMDLLVPGVGEIIGGSQREERMDVLKARIEELGLNEEDYWWYLELRKYGTAKHAGFGLGFERAIMYLTGMANIRDVVSFPRTVKNADF